MTWEQAGASDDARQLMIWGFPQGEDLWRVSWFGPIAFPNRYTKRSEPSVLVHLTKVIDPQALVDPTRPITPASTSARSVKRWLSIGQAVLLRIGDLWQGQKWHSRPAQQGEKFPDLEISKETTVIIKAGSSLESGGYLIPMGEHPWHMENTHSYCLRVALGGGRFLVLPAMELIRFYFGSSSVLLSKLFSPPLQKEHLFSNFRRTLLGRHMFLDIADGIPKQSAADIARMAGDNKAWFAAMNIGRSCLEASTRGADAYPVGLFPFEGKTDLTVSGQWLSQDWVAGQTFLVFRILSCSHEFPFNKLTVRCGSKPKRASRSVRPAMGEAKAAPFAGAVRPQKPRLVNEDGSPQLSRGSYQFESDRAFPDLLRKPVVRQVRLQAAGGVAVHGSPAVSELATGNETSSKRVRTVTLAEKVGGKTKAPPEFLQPILDAFLQLEGVEAHLLTDSEDDGWTIPMTTLIDEDGVIESRLMIEAPGAMRPRRLAAFLLGSQSDRLTTVFIESEPLFPLAYPAELCDAEEAHATLVCAAKDFLRRLDLPQQGFSIAMGSGPSSSSAEAMRKWASDYFQQGTDPDHDDSGVARDTIHGESGPN
ncbi:hypothetical protein [Ideonella paludis]|uniref:Uncharacterized protein n=1 Tax=Ideonella paludis TaxID=1233411 RepID=A0ABS5E3B5_9BURK|nr:hypothetical protein [Ideonella paludis]MBQ0937902.1 hypothetical protein [Ideonella paludis]